MANAEEKLRKTSQLTKTPNAFLAYRMALQKEFAALNLYPNMRELSTAAGNAWEKEPEYVKARYNRLMLDTRTLFQRVSQAVLPLQIVHVNPNEQSNQNDRIPNDDVKDDWNPSEINAIIVPDTDTNDLSPSYISLSASINSALTYPSPSPTPTSTFVGYNQNTFSNEFEMNSPNSIDSYDYFSGNPFHFSDPMSPTSGYQQLDYLANEANSTSNCTLVADLLAERQHVQRS
ncbi:7564_t:CDS:2 [Ambispora gerdemannii]|uniref:7564_t:CDS:1 n=1 Tax=Ambispora gerdemannii TaxID=144530 RepID=A0A9N8YT31_9GLOM|nr:7564_t:CDS:2 [Ambispora gerdemannii]